jgi:uncharacterized protein (TIGR02996 family)
MARKSASSERQAILDDVIAHPDDDTPRLVYADWLDEHGDSARAEFIRVQVHGAGLPFGSAEEVHLRKRGMELLRQHRRAWENELPQWCRHKVSFERGLAGSIECTGRSWLKGAGGLYRRAPVTSVALYALDDDTLVALGGRPELYFLRSLDLWLSVSQPCTPPALRALLHSRHLSRLRHLDLRFEPNALPMLQVACAAPLLAGLRKLTVRGGNLGQAGGEVLAGTAALAGLSDLETVRTGLGSGGLAALARSPHLRNLERLLLWESDIGDEGVVALADSPVLDRVRVLRLGGNRGITSAGVLALARSAHVAALRCLDLARVAVGREAGLALAERLAGLERLCVEQEGLDEAARAALRRRLGAGLEVVTTSGG